MVGTSNLGSWNGHWWYEMRRKKDQGWWKRPEHGLFPWSLRPLALSPPSMSSAHFGLSWGSLGGKTLLSGKTAFMLSFLDLILKPENISYIILIHTVCIFIPTSWVHPLSRLFCSFWWQCGYPFSNCIQKKQSCYTNLNPICPTAPWNPWSSLSFSFAQSLRSVGKEPRAKVLWPWGNNLDHAR